MTTQSATTAPPSAASDIRSGQSSLRERFRVESGDRHASLDRQFEGLAVEDTPSLYHGFIRMTQACHAAIEPILEASPLPAAMPEWGERRQSGALGADLREMNLAPLAPLPFPLPRPDLAQSLGIAYVLEGSRLGARSMRKALRARMAQAPWSATSFYYFETANEPDQFRGFLVRASDLLLQDAARDRAVDAANITFDYFLDTERSRLQTDEARRTLSAGDAAA